MKYVFTVEGMMCEKCVARLTNVLKAEDGVQEVIISLAEKTVTVDAACPATTIKTAIEDAGFDACEI